MLSILTKALLFFALGAGLVAVSIQAKKLFVPYLAGIMYLVIQFALYTMISPQSKLSAFKYLSFFGILRTEELFGGYLNLNIGGEPVSWRFLALLLLMVSVILCCGAAIFLFGRGSQLTIQRQYPTLGFRPHNSLLRHEAYKILIMNKGIIVFLIFGVFISYIHLGKDYTPSSDEQYYYEMTEQLKGSLTPEKEELILSEKARFEEAQKQVEEIENLIYSGEIDELTGEYRKMKWEGVLSFYPYFQRILNQYDYIREYDGSFIYESGYYYLFGKMDDGYKEISFV